MEDFGFTTALRSESVYIVFRFISSSSLSYNTLSSAFIRLDWIKTPRHRAASRALGIQSNGQICTACPHLSALFGFLSVASCFPSNKDDGLHTRIYFDLEFQPDSAVF
uniref:Uncharacterized mitochondrial protein AtMg00720 n=1 Tax=Arabidopsis thaliana TaxID=3702 RepID=M720_ARATH|nr:RecName: Full=Uncharacterized mitochondrial protein AtMg00720; AltName: Full=ORF107d [Arabidopsis thaliana]CAA69817.1 unnamed protein product [Arabidopsis thaliana]